MRQKQRVIKRGTVRQIIKPIHPSLPEKVEIRVHEADELYSKLRIENSLEDENGYTVKAKEHADVDVVIEADSKATTDADGQKG